MAGKGKMAEEWNKHRPLKVTVVGDGGVGKTCLLTSYFTGEFKENPEFTIYETHNYTVAVDGVDYPLKIFDTAGSEKHDKLRPLSYFETHVIILCFALGNRESFENVSSKFLPELHEYCPKLPIVLVEPT